MKTKDFKDQLVYLLDRGYRNVSLEDVATGREKANLRERTFAVTFDDGYRDNYLHAMPVLRELGLRATIFVTVSYVDTNRLYHWYQAEELAAWGGAQNEDYSVTWSQMHEMQNSGVFSIGSHTLSHPKLANIEAESAHHEIVEAKRVLERRLGQTIALFCYPYGSLNRQVMAMTRDAGYALAVVTPPRPVPRSRYTLPRIGVYGGTDFREFKRKSGTLFQTLLWAGVSPYVQAVHRKVRRQRSL